MRSFYSKHQRFINAFLPALIPVTVCLLRALVAKRSLFDVWFCGSNWQDELYYWQLTNDVIHFGVPQGYFGFNESSAQILSFSAWSPFLLIFWVLPGLIFGWGFLSPVIFNIVLFSIALFIFAYLVKPRPFNTLLLGLLLFVMTPLSRFLMSCMAEIQVISVLIVFLGFSFAMYDSYKRSYLVGAMILLSLMTLMRPYLVMFLVFPTVALFKHGKNRIVPGAVGVISLVLYLLENKFFAPKYFDDYFRTDWIKSFFTDGLKAGFSNMFASIKNFGSQILGLVWPGIRYGKDGIAAYYGVFVAFTVIFIALSVISVITKRKYTAYIISMALLYLAMFFAIVLMYKVDEGYRHVLLFVVAGILILAVTADHITGAVTSGIAFLLITWVFVYKARSDYFYHVSFADEGVDMIEDIRAQMDTNMELKDGITWDNTVIWVSADYIEERDEYSETLWRMLYGLPAGYALNICSAEYVNLNIDSLKSGYIATVPGGTVEKNLLAGNAREIARNEYFVMYDIR